jgi:hypothetical protein
MKRAHRPRAGRRGVGRRGRTGHAPDGGAPDREGARAAHARGRGRGRWPASGGRGAPDRGAPDGEGARAARWTEGRRTERVHGPGMQVGGGVRRAWAAGERAARSGCSLRARAVKS